MFVKVSSTYINTDQVVAVDDYGILGEERAIDLTMAAPDTSDYSSDTVPHAIRLRGEDAEAFIRWLKTHALDLTSNTEEAEGFRYYREAGGEMLFSEWLRVYKLHKQHIESGRISPYEGELLL